MYIYKFLFRMTNTMTPPPQNIDLSSWDILYNPGIENLVDLREIGWGGMDWIYLAQDGDQWRVLVNTVMNLRVP
jgi:hypothetical protein